MERHPVVDLDGDPKAAPNTPMQRRRLRWLWLPVIGALAVLGVGLGIWLSGEDELRIEPPVIVGLADEPTYAWQVSVPASSTYATVGDAVVVYPYVLGTDGAAISLVDIDSGDERWRQDYRDYLPEPRLHNVHVRDLPGTSRLTVTLTQASEVRSTRVLVVNRSNGEVVANHVPAGMGPDGG